MPNVDGTPHHLDRQDRSLPKFEPMKPITNIQTGELPEDELPSPEDKLRGITIVNKFKKVTSRDTPYWVAKKLVELACPLGNISPFVKPFDKIFDCWLEPSAGNGVIADAITEAYNFQDNLHCIELNGEKAFVLQTKGYRTFHADFLDPKISNQQYKRITAAPPFKDNVDLRHIMKMYDMLLDGGVLVSLTTPYWMTNNEAHQVEFREWLRVKTYDMRMLPDNVFTERGRTVPTAIIRIFK